MIVFPQLTTGAGAQYPLVRRRRCTSVVNVLADGSTVAYADSTPRSNTWSLALRDLTDMEADSIQRLFETVEGRQGNFTFLDPAANLLAHSEELDNSCWNKDPMLQLNTGVDDPVGGRRAMSLVNSGQSVQNLSQTLNAPGWFGYAFSVYARSTANSALSLIRSGQSSTHARVFSLGPGWTRCVLSGALNVSDESVRFALELPAGASVDLYGIQAEAQPSASAYKATRDRNGVYSNARFDDDVLLSFADGPDQHRLDLRIVARD